MGPLCLREACVNCKVGNFYLQASEALLFKTYDSKRAPERPCGVFHTAFELPETPTEAPPRTSVEARTIALWDD